MQDIGRCVVMCQNNTHPITEMYWYSRLTEINYLDMCIFMYHLVLTTINHNIFCLNHCTHCTFFSIVILCNRHGAHKPSGVSCSLCSWCFNSIGVIAQPNCILILILFWVCKVSRGVLRICQFLKLEKNSFHFRTKVCLLCSAVNIGVVVVLYWILYLFCIYLS